MSEKKESPIRKKVDYSKLLESKYVRKWVDCYKNGQQNARLSVLEGFCKFLDKKPDEILLEHHRDMIQENPTDIENIGTKRILAYYQYLIGQENNINSKMTEKTISPNSARQYCFSKLPSYFDKNNVMLKFKKGDVPGEKKATKDKTWRSRKERIDDKDTKECIKRIRDTFKNVRNKAILLCKISSGMDDVDLFNLKLKDYKEGYFPTDKISYLEGYRQKSGILFQTFFNSEACNMLDMYLNERKQQQEELTDDSWLFVNKNKKVISQLKPFAFAKSLKEVCKILNLTNITPKGFRRWFSTELKENNVRDEFVERMMGHKVMMSQRYETKLSNPNTFAKIYVDKIEPFTLLGNGKRHYGELDKKVETLEVANNALKNELVNTNKKLDALLDLMKTQKLLKEKELEKISQLKSEENSDK